MKDFVQLCQAHTNGGDERLRKDLAGVVLSCGFSKFEFLEIGGTSLLLKAVDHMKKDNDAALNVVVLKVPFRGNINYNMLFNEYSTLCKLAESKQQENSNCFIVKPIAFIVDLE